MTCPHCGEETNQERLPHGRVLCNVCSKVRVERASSAGDRATPRALWVTPTPLLSVCERRTYSTGSIRVTKLVTSDAWQRKIADALSPKHKAPE